MNGHKIIVTKRKAVRELLPHVTNICEKKFNRPYLEADIKRLRTKLNRSLRLEYEYAYGWIYPGFDGIMLTKNACDEIQCARTISHETIHIVVEQLVDTKTSKALDNPKGCRHTIALNQRGSILKILEKEGYIGGI